MGDLITLQPPPSAARALRPLIWAILLLLGVALLACLRHLSPGEPPQSDITLSPSVFIVVDGDTIRSPAGIATA
jgi:hypothetical protein